MTKDQWMVLGLKAGSIGAVIAIFQWVAVYTRLQPWWRKGNHIGRSLVLLAGFSVVTPALFILSLFWHLNRGTSQALGWAEVTVLLAYIPAMAWRSVIWIRSARAGERGSLPCGKKDGSGR